MPAICPDVDDEISLIICARAGNIHTHLGPCAHEGLHSPAGIPELEEQREREAGGGCC